MKNLKRLSTGFIASVMMLSLILAPMPKINTSWAQTADSTSQTEVDCEEDAMNQDGSGRVYKPGCELDSALTQAQLDNVYGNDKEGLKKWGGLVDKAIMAMMSVVLIENTAFKYRYAYDNQLYGNDCPQNVIANYTVRAAQLAALSYVLGTAQANVLFKEQSKLAIDEQFSAQAKDYVPDENSVEVQTARENGERDPRLTALENNNQQIASFDRMIEILKMQRDSVKVKKNLAIVATSLFAAAGTLETGNISQCKAKCQQDVIDVNMKKTSAEKGIKNAEETHASFMEGLDSLALNYSATCSAGAAALPTPRGACLPLKALMQSTKGTNNALDAKYKRTGTLKENKIDISDLNSSQRAINIFEKISETMTPKAKDLKVNESDDLKKVINDFIKEQNQDINELTKDMASASTLMPVNTGSFTNYLTALTTCKAALQTWMTTTLAGSAACVPPSPAGCGCPAMASEIGRKINLSSSEMRNALASFDHESAIREYMVATSAESEITNQQPLVNPEEVENLKSHIEQEFSKASSLAAGTTLPDVKNAIDQMLAEETKYEFATTQCCGNRGVSVVDAKNLKEMFDVLVTNSAPFTKTSEVFQQKKNFVQQIEKTYSAGKNKTNIAVAAPGGSFLHQGLIKNSVMGKVKDIQILSLKEILGIEKKQSFFMGPNSKRDQLFSAEFMIPKVIENEMYTYAYSHFIDWDSKNPKLITKQMAQVNKQIQQSVKEIEKAMHEKMFPPGPVLASEQERLKDFMKVVINVLSGFSPISNAHAFDSTTNLIVGAGAQFAASQLEGGWAEALNVSAKYFMLKALLQKLGGTEFFTKPRGRAWLWKFLSLLGSGISSYDHQILQNINGRIGIMEKEKERFMNSAATRTSLNLGNRGGQGSNAFQKTNLTAHTKIKNKIKACAVPKGDSFAPAPCPTVIPRKAFEFPKLQNRLKGIIKPSVLGGMSLVTDTLHGAATGQSFGGSNLDSGKLAQIESMNNALKIAMNKAIKKMDEEEAKSNANKKVKSTPLQKSLASLKRAFGISNSEGSSASSFTSAKGSDYRVDNADKEKTTKKADKIAAVMPNNLNIPKAPKTGGFDLDFGDNQSDSNFDSKTTLGASSRKEQKLEDFVIEHDDISKRKDVPIWKILSNRYILSYPKVLEEARRK